MADMIELTYPDGSKHAFEKGVTGLTVASSIGKRLAADAVAVKVNGTVLDVTRPITQSGNFAVVTPKSRDGKMDADALYCMRHTAEHIMTEAICRLWPDTKLVYGPPVEDGFYGDIDLDSHKISIDDFPKIEAEMAKIVAENRPMTRYELPRAEGMKKIQAEGNPYKVDNAERASGDVLSFYVTGANVGKDFEDLCMGPHVPSTGRIGAFKLTAVAGAYFRGDEKNKQLQRIYGTAFPTQKDLEEHFARIDEAKKRDHRVIGKQFGLFTMSPLVGQGLVLWMPNGGIIRTELQNLMQGELTKRGYKPVFTPHIGSVELYKTSGHFPYYKDSQYPTLKSEAKKENGEAEEEYLLKPMNCPHHIQIYAAEPHSYRDLPIRLAEFGTVYRYEQSGELNGMTRVRGLTQDDAHLFCTPEQVEKEIQSTVGLVQTIFGALGLKDYRVQVSLRDPASDKYTGDPAKWNMAEETLKRVAKDMNLPHEAVPGEAAFYGPKLDFMVKDCIGREWQLGTVQLDYNLPERFKLEYIGSDNNRHRPVMIHRAPFGSFERFVGILIEHFAGAFPLWLAPTQVRVANITDKQEEASLKVVQMLAAEGFRVEADLGKGKINAKVAESEAAKIPYLLVIGDREAQAGTVAVRGRGRKDLGTMPVAEFIAKAKAEIAERQI
ncbi:MAG TPA: threonine--tRNA ligase [Planctomycetota bacterium]|nr:threonine--tRNA ligase [Planctomycetota bacterium]